MRILLTCVALTFVFSNLAQAQWAPRPSTHQEACRFSQASAFNEMLCSYPHLINKFNELQKLRYNLPRSEDTMNRFSSFYEAIFYICRNAQPCVEKAVNEFHAHVVQRKNERDDRIAKIRKQRQQNCPEQIYQTRRASCVVMFSAEYECNEYLSGEKNDLAGRSTVSAAICSSALQSLTTGEIKLKGLAFSLSSGLADDISDSYKHGDSVSDAFNSALFKLGSLSILGWGLKSCLDDVNITCGRY